MVTSSAQDFHHDAETSAWLRLLLTPGLGRSAARRLLAKAGGAEQIWQLPPAAWRECVTEAQSQALVRLPEQWPTHQERLQRWLKEPAAGCFHAMVPLGHAEYPKALLQTEDPPLLLFVQGPVALQQYGQPWFPYPQSLAMVGSRNPSAQGVINAREIAQALAEQGLCIVSGLALGIDAAAHEGALKAAKGSAPLTALTIAVVGTGLDQVYPRAHLALAAQIMQRGLLISEYPLGTEPRPGHFPQRNRIISGLTQGTLVVEAALKSGSLITARLASEQGREVFAIPGSIHAPQAKGCHALLRQGAKLVETAADVLDELQGINRPETQFHQAQAATNTEAEHPLLQALGHDPLTLDSLTERTGWDAAHLQAQLMELELDGQVARLPGGLYQRITRG
ncbi:MAG: DNA-processing protein DprA [Comamonas sp.]|jgi:DNA processing protein|uniref:DNA-processing protein DprA n=1 Tax=Comamonas sp. TaxID=34028 RepID=UPI002828A426|nr:DNA-processing protein DprA [Comamonas sp.]MDR0214780.1 DNA-processing protein DprA [Comamonas sp.]